MTIVGVAISVIIVAACLMPVLNDAVATTDTIRNEGFLRMSHVDTDDPDTYVIEWDKATNPNIITVNGVDIKINPPVGELRFNVVFDTNWLIRAVSPNNSATISGLQLYKTSGGTNSISNSMTLTCSAGSWTISYDAAGSNSGTYTDLYIPDNDGIWSMKANDKAAHVLKDSEFIAYGLTAINNPSIPGNTIAPGYGLLITGTIEDGVTISTWRSVNNYGTPSFSDDSVNYTDSARWNEVYDLSSVTFKITTVSTADDAVISETDATYSYFLVPYEITAERIVHFAPGEIAIFSVIPLLIIIAILIMAVSIINRNRE